MPTYDYQCDACGHDFSALQSWTDEPLERCPRCGARPRRLISVPAIHFKGSGWHSTDYARKGSTDSDSKGGGDKKTPESASQKEPDTRSGTSRKADAAAAE